MSEELNSWIVEMADSLIVEWLKCWMAFVLDGFN